MSPQTVGRALSQQREQRGITLERAAEATHIRKHYLQALEEGNFGALPSAAQVRGFLRAYASYLDLDAEDLFELLRQPAPEAAAADAPSVEAEPQAAAAATIAPPPTPRPEKAVPTAEIAAIGAQLVARRQQIELT